MTTKAERQQEWKQRHLKALASIGFTGSYRTLRTLENRANYNALRYCNGEQGINSHGEYIVIKKAMTQEEYDQAQDKIEKKVKALFGGNLPAGFFINGDPRGYALKIDNNVATIPAGMHTDWGGYGILAPDEF